MRRGGREGKREGSERKVMFCYSHSRGIIPNVLSEDIFLAVEENWARFTVCRLPLGRKRRG